MTKTQALRALTPEQRQKSRVIHSLLNDESVPMALTIAARVLRAAAHKFDRSEQGRYEAMAELYAAAVAFNEELEKS